MTLTRIKALTLLAALATALMGGRALVAQSYTQNTTTLAADQAATDTTISLTSASAASGSSFGAVVVGQAIYVDNELELITGTTGTSTVFAVQRRGNSPATLHKTGAPVYIAPAATFQKADPPPGKCVQANQPAYWININGPAAANGGRIFTCSPGGIWALGSAPWNQGFNSGNGATVTLGAAQSGQMFLFDRAAGIAYTLPAPYPGLWFDFVVSTTITSNNAEVEVATPASQFVQGTLEVAGVATTTSFSCNGTSHVALKLNGTTTGGILGSWMRFHAVSTTLWQVEGILTGSGTGATPCATSV